ncbi:SDR family oxidoreductase [Desulfobacterales bacterium HSG2]|nr:SDR family oxidoreductase [Desulfobacterales bacterium HSG2]
MQAIQTQTAETHKKFLETQTEASRTLNMMMENTQRLAEVSMGLRAPDTSVSNLGLGDFSPAAPSIQIENERDMMSPSENGRRRIEEQQTSERTEVPATPNISDAPATSPSPVIHAHTPEVSVEKPDTPRVRENAENRKSEIENPKPEIQTAMLDVVSELTGYPAEMLSMDMDIEADLGIDSIKRVEILSTLEEKMPGLPPVSPEIMGTLKTLAQIAEYLVGNSKPETENRKPETENRKPKTGNRQPETGNQKSEIEAGMLEVVSQLTGYPTEMLSMDMDIEADLGIDSIKRVEILSTLEEKMPGLPPVSPEIMGTLKTLAQIAEYLEGNSKPETGNRQPETGNRKPSTVNRKPETGNQKSEIEAGMMEVVSQLTGYPTEMLSMEMDIEADLGIDSIKRVEILSTLEEKMPGLPSVSPEVMGTLKTLGQIAEYLVENLESETRNSEPETRNSEIRNPKSEIEMTMLEVVSDLTGYPGEMLSMEMDIEADLGIDSIKRVEILSTLEEKMPGLPSVSPEVMGTLKTLGQIAEYLFGNSKPSTGNRQPETVNRKPSTGNRQPETVNRKPSTGNRQPETHPAIERKTISVVNTPLEGEEYVSIPAGRKILVTDDRNGLGQMIVNEFEAVSMDALLISPDEVNNGHNLPPAGGLVILPNPDLSLKDAFALTRHAAPDILESAKKGGAILGTVARLDGAFGFKGKGVQNPLQGGLAGLAKTAAVEWEDVCCHAIDIAPDWKENEAIAKAVVSELIHPGPVEVGLEPDARFTFELESSPYPRGEISLAAGDVVVISGGARGVTASAAYSLAMQVKPTLVLLGRSPIPSREPEWLASAEGEAAVKKAILENEFKGKRPSPVQLEEAFRRLMANREISENLERLNSTGATALYYSVDVRDAESVKSVLNEVRSAYGPIKGIIHAAGMLEDRLIVDKTPEQFERVFDTKVKGLDALLEATRSDDLRHIVLFSSVSARLGNRGQVDYAMANEVLNKTAQQECAIRPDCSVVSVNWGPWDGGMVSPALKREFERKGIKLIPVDEGASCMLCEMMGGKDAPVEVVIGAEWTEDPAPRLSLSFKRELDVDRYPILGAHILDGKPVVPFALMTEWLGHGALHENPGLLLHGLDDIRLLSGIKVHQDKKLIRLLAGKAKKKGDVYEVDVEIRNGVKNGKEVIHSKAKAILTDTLSQPPSFNVSADVASEAYSKSIEEVYETILFHGLELRGIREVVSCSSRGMTAKIASAPSPEKWMEEPLRSRWIGDPLVLDSAFQMAIIWCFEEKGLVSLPAYSASYRQYRDRFPSDGVTAVLEVKKAGEHKIKGDFTFLDDDNTVVARLTGYEAIMDASLFKAFKS